MAPQFLELRGDVLIAQGRYAGLRLNSPMDSDLTQLARSHAKTGNAELVRSICKVYLGMKSLESLPGSPDSKMAVGGDGPADPTTCQIVPYRPVKVAKEPVGPKAASTKEKYLSIWDVICMYRPSFVTFSLRKYLLHFFVISTVTILLVPSLAEIPAKFIGFIIRAFADRCKAVVHHFWSALIKEMGDIGQELWAYIDSFVHTSTSPMGEHVPYPFGKTVVYLGLGFVMKYIVSLPLIAN